VSPYRNRPTSPAWSGRRVIRAPLLPGGGLYARHVLHPEGVDGVHRPNVRPARSRTSTARAAFERGWLQANLGRLDLVHVLALTGPAPSAAVARTAGEATAATAAALATVREAGRPLVVTAYHLSDPTGFDRDGPSGRSARLDQLVPGADAVITLTRSAADEIAQRWAVDALVLPHPHVVDFVRMRRPRPPRRPGHFVVGVNLGSLRLPTSAVDFLRALTRALGVVGQADLRVLMNRAVTEPGTAAYSPREAATIEQIVRHAGGTLLRHPPLTEIRLWDHIGALDVAVVPGMFGSHSIWPEACADLGTALVMPAGLHASGQQPCLTYQGDAGVDCGDVVAESLAKALWAARENGPLRPADPRARWAQRAQVCEQHRRLYERLLVRTGWDTRPPRPDR
jgi:hypothetical protein